MRAFKILTMLIIPCVLLFACGNMPVKDDPCMTPAAVDSVICEKLAAIGISVYDANLLFKLANLELVKQGAYAKEDCLTFLDNVESIIDSATYNDVAAYIVMEATDLKTKYGAEIILLMDYFNRFEGIALPITEFDKKLLKEHINQQRQTLGMLTIIEIKNCRNAKWDNLDQYIDDAAKRADIILGVAK